MANNKFIRSDLLLLTTAAIWGFAFVAQRTGMKFVGPFTFNAIRFLLGALVLIPIVLIRKPNSDKVKSSPLISRYGCIAAGVVLFLGSSLQQMGIVYTTAGKAGFITGLYLLIVPLMGLFWKQKIGWRGWIGVVLACLGLYLLSIKDNFTFASGDLMVLAAAFFWAAHVHIIDRLSKIKNPLKIAIKQYLICSVLSLIVAYFREIIALDQIFKAGIPILYAGILSVGIAYTLQVVAQKKAPPSHAAIILSMESVFALIGGTIILHEHLSLRGLLGCSLMLAGMILSQLNRTRKVKLLESF